MWRRWLSSTAAESASTPALRTTVPPPSARAPTRPMLLPDVSFRQVGVASSLFGKLQKLRFEHPTPIQAEAIRVLTAHPDSDAVVTAPTGTGKTMAYALPLVARVLANHQRGSHSCRAVVVVPTRELAHQVTGVLEDLLRPSLRKARQHAAALGGVSLAASGGQGAGAGTVAAEPIVRKFVGEVTQLRLSTLRSDPPDVVVGTPRTLAALIPLHLPVPHLEMLVLDEADHLLLEFSRRFTTKLLAQARRRKARPQVVLVTATVSEAVEAARSKYLRGEPLPSASTLLDSTPRHKPSSRRNPDPPSSSSSSERRDGTVRASASVADRTIVVDLSRTWGRFALPRGLRHLGVLCDSNSAVLANDDEGGAASSSRLMVDLGRERALRRIIATQHPRAALVFCASSDEASRVHAVLTQRGTACDVILPSSPNRDRARAFSRLANGSCRVLVGTDQLSRGLDLPRLTHVINYRPPSDALQYLHRAGRVGRLERAAAAARGNAAARPAAQRTVPGRETLVSLVSDSRPADDDDDGDDGDDEEDEDDDAGAGEAVSEVRPPTPRTSTSAGVVFTGGSVVTLLGSPAEALQFQEAMGALALGEQSTAELAELRGDDVAILRNYDPDTAQWARVGSVAEREGERR